MGVVPRPIAAAAIWPMKYEELKRDVMVSLSFYWQISMSTKHVTWKSKADPSSQNRLSLTTTLLDLFRADCEMVGNKDWGENRAEIHVPDGLILRSKKTQILRRWLAEYSFTTIEGGTATRGQDASAWSEKLLGLLMQKIMPNPNTIRAKRYIPTKNLGQRRDQLSWQQSIITVLSKPLYQCANDHYYRPH